MAYLSRETVKWLKIWLGHAGISERPIFRRLIGRDENGGVLHPGSIAPIFKRVAQWIGMPRLLQDSEIYVRQAPTSIGCLLHRHQSTLRRNMTTRTVSELLDSIDVASPPMYVLVPFLNSPLLRSFPQKMLPEPNEVSTGNRYFWQVSVNAPQ